MKKTIFKVISAICVFAIFITAFPNFTYAADEKFISLNISGYDSSQQETTTTNNPFYVKNGIIYAPVKILEDYTMYNYDSQNNAFVRIGQEYTSATSKVVLDYDNQQVHVFYSQLHRETYDIDIHSFAGIYFLPLSQMAAYLKASVVYKDEKTISIVSSGISLSDALYDYSVYDSSLDYIRVLDDLFVGEEKLYYQYTVLGYVKSTIFSCKVSKLISSWGNYDTCCSIIENAVTNTDIYQTLGDENAILATLGYAQSAFYEQVYKKANKMYKLSINSIVTMFEDYKKANSFGDESPYDNFFEEEQLQIDALKDFGKEAKYVNHFIEYAEYIYKFYTINDDNRLALATIAEINQNGSVGNAFDKCYTKYGADIGTSVISRVKEDLLEETTEEILKNSAKSIFASVNKVKLATEIVSGVFKLAGFDLKDNSSYDVLLAHDVVTYITSNSDSIQNENLKTMDDSENLRLSLIMTILTQIEGFKIGNKIAEQLAKEDTDHYKTDIEKLSRHLSLLYLANSSKKYDSVEGVKLVEKQNKKQLAKLNLKNNVIDAATAEGYLKASGGKNELVELIYNFPKYGMNTGDVSISIEIIDLNNDQIPEVLYCSHYGATGVPGLGKIFIFNGQKFVEGQITCGVDASTDFPVLPMKNSNTTVFVSEIRNSAELDSYDGPPGFSSFWHYHSAYIYNFKLSNNTLSIDVFRDYSDFRNRIQSAQPGDIDRYNAWEEYKLEIKQFDEQFVLDAEHPYTIISNIGTGYIPEDLPTEEKLDIYHQTMTKEAAEFIVQQYYNNVHEVLFSQYFDAAY